MTRKHSGKPIRFLEDGETGLEERSRRPHAFPNETPHPIATELLKQKRKHSSWGARKVRKIVGDAHPEWRMPAEVTVNRLFDREGLVKRRRRHRRMHPKCPKSQAQGPNDIWAADYKGQFRLKNGSYCFPLTVSDLYSRYLLGCEGHRGISKQRSRAYFERLFREYGLPNRIRTDNGVPFASNALARLSRLSVWFIKLGIYPELIEPGRPEQNGIQERMHRTMKADATIPPEYSLEKQQERFELFREEFNTVRPHDGIGLQRPAELYRLSARRMPSKVETYDYPGHYVVRRVSRAGTVRLHTRQFFVATPLMEDYIGFEEVQEAVYDMYFCFYLIGRYHEREHRIEGVISKVPVSRPMADAGWKSVTDV